MSIWDWEDISTLRASSVQLDAKISLPDEASRSKSLNWGSKPGVCYLLCFCV